MKLSEVFLERLNKLHGRMLAAGLDYIFLPISINQYYLSGLNLKKTERLTALVVDRDKVVTVICPAFELGRVESQLILPADRVITWEEQEDPYQKTAELFTVCGAKVGVEGTAWFSEYNRLARCIPDAAFVDIHQIFSALRIKKNEWEKQRIKKAIEIIDEAREAMLEQIKIGTSEIEACEILRKEAISRGGKNPSLHGVHMGVNSSFAHGGSEAVTVEEGTVLLIDAGVFCDGYRSDITRTVAFGEPPEGFVEVFNVVLAAQKAALAAIEPGMPAEKIDSIGRQVIEEAGYGEFFTHRLGHGLGMEVHEAPWIGPGQKDPVEPGMVFTVEPGIYLPGRFGVRIEENIIVTDGGCEILSKPLADFLE